MIAISVRQPWATALLHRLKPVENRSWPMPPKYVNKPLLLHAGKAKPRPGEWSGFLFERVTQLAPQHFGGIIGEIVFALSVRDFASQWAEPGLWHWPVVRVRPLPFQPYKGRLGFFPVPVETLNDAICAALAGGAGYRFRGYRHVNAPSEA